MWKNLFAALLLLTLAPCAFAQHESETWTRFSPPGGGFSILIPQTPSEQVENKDTPVHYTSHLFSTREPNLIYLIGYTDYDPKYRFNAESELIANRDNFIKGVNGKLDESVKINFDGQPGIEFTAEAGAVFFKSRVYIKGSRVWQVAVAVTTGQRDNESAEKFLNSFKFTKEQ
jgi:hypothetical protein